MRPNLLTQVALTIGSRQGENVATAALVQSLHHHRPVGTLRSLTLRAVGDLVVGLTPRLAKVESEAIRHPRLRPPASHGERSPRRGPIVADMADRQAQAAEFLDPARLSAP